MIFRHLHLRQQPACTLLKTTEDKRKFFGKPSIFSSFEKLSALKKGIFFKKKKKGDE